MRKACFRGVIGEKRAECLPASVNAVTSAAGLIVFVSTEGKDDKPCLRKFVDREALKTLFSTDLLG